MNSILLQAAINFLGQVLPQYQIGVAAAEVVLVNAWIAMSNADFG